MVAFLFYCGIEGSMGLWGSSYLVQVRGLDAATAAAWVSSFYGAITVGRFISGFITMKLSNKALIRIGEVMILAGVILTARFASARADAGQGMTLTVVTCVLLGGVSIFGGKGTILGVVLAWLALSILGNALRLGNVATELQSIAVGMLLILSVVIQSAAREFGSLRERWQARQRSLEGASDAAAVEGR